MLFWMNTDIPITIITDTFIQLQIFLFLMNIYVYQIEGLSNGWCWTSRWQLGHDGITSSHLEDRTGIKSRIQYKKF